MTFNIYQCYGWGASYVHLPSYPNTLPEDDRTIFDGIRIFFSTISIFIILSRVQEYFTKAVLLKIIIFLMFVMSSIFIFTHFFLTTPSGRYTQKKEPVESSKDLMVIILAPEPAVKITKPSTIEKPGTKRMKKPDKPPAKKISKEKVDPKPESKLKSNIEEREIKNNVTRRDRINRSSGITSSRDIDLNYRGTDQYSNSVPTYSPKEKINRIKSPNQQNKELIGYDFGVNNKYSSQTPNTLSQKPAENGSKIVNDIASNQSKRIKDSDSLDHSLLASPPKTGPQQKKDFVIIKTTLNYSIPNSLRLNQLKETIYSKIERRLNEDGEYCFEDKYGNVTARIINNKIEGIEIIPKDLSNVLDFVSHVERDLTDKLSLCD